MRKRGLGAIQNDCDVIGYALTGPPGLARCGVRYLSLKHYGDGDEVRTIVPVRFSNFWS